MKYVVGFMFSEDHTRVVLIEKIKPLWQAGCLNGVGGKIEETDGSPVAAMRREFGEEAGVENTSWLHFGRMEGPDWSVDLFAGRDDEAVKSVKTCTAERITVVRVNSLGEYKLLDNLKWHVEMALDCLIDGRPHFAVITYPPQ